LPGVPGSPEFMAAYNAALGGTPVPPPASSAPARTHTVNELVAAYLDGPQSPFGTLSPVTQRTRRYIFERFCAAHGDKRTHVIDDTGKPTMLLTRDHMQVIINEKAANPPTQRNLLFTLRALFQWAAAGGRVPDDPTIGVKRQKMKKTTGFKTWSEEEIARFEARHPVGTRPRLALALMLYTGLRRADVVRVGRQHIQKNVLIFDTGKTKGQEQSHLEIPVHPELARIIKVTPSEHLTFLTTSFGKPYTPGGIGGAMRDWCDEAGCDDVSSHGLRKACARRLAEAGATAAQIASITGHATLAEVQRYINAADRKHMARAAMAKLSGL